MTTALKIYESAFNGAWMRRDVTVDKLVNFAADKFHVLLSENAAAWILNCHSDYLDDVETLGEFNSYIDHVVNNLATWEL